MSTQAWIAVGSVVFACGLLLLAIWRGFTVPKIGILGVVELQLPHPLEMKPRRFALLPASALIIAGVVTLSIGFFQNVFPSPPQTVSISETPSSNNHGQLASNVTSKNEEVTFQNKTHQAVSLYWVDFDGKPQTYTTIAPEESADVSTYAGHLWIAKSAAGAILLRYVVRDTHH